MAKAKAKAKPTRRTSPAGAAEREARRATKQKAASEKRLAFDAALNALVLRLLEYEFEYLHEDLRDDCPELFDYLEGRLEEVEERSPLWDELCRLDSLWSDYLEELIDSATWEEHEHLTRAVLMALPSARGYDTAGEALGYETMLFLERTGVEFDSVRGRKELRERLQAATR